MTQVYIRKIYLVMALLIMTLSQSCTKEPSHDGTLGNKGNINIKLSTKSLELSNEAVKTVRVVVCYQNGSDKIVFNESNLSDIGGDVNEGLFTISIPGGRYTFYAIVNEPANLTATLDGLTTKSSLKEITISPETPFTEKTVMLWQKKDAVVAIDADGNATIDGSNTPLTMALDRVSAKVSLKVIKTTTEPEDKFTITKVDFVQFPSHSFLIGKPYDGTSFVSRELFKGAIEFTQNSVSQDIIASIPADGKPSNIVSEYLIEDANKSDHSKAAYFAIRAKYTPKGESPRDVYYQIPVGNYNGNNAVDAEGHDYNLKRNVEYELSLKINKQGEKEAVEIEFTVSSWVSKWVNVDIDGDPFLDVSNVDVSVYDAAATRVYFYSNMPSVELDPQLLNGTQPVPVDDNFVGLIGDDPLNFSYKYNSTTKRGEGYFDLVNVHTDNAVSVRRLLRLKSGKLVREIAATTSISAEVAKNNTQPYIGTFHRANERGERIVSWHLPVGTKWKVEIVKSAADDGGTSVDAQYYADANYLRIDHLASPNHSKLYTLDPPNPEGAFVTDDDKVIKLEGADRIYFRVGWSGVISATSHRFAKIKVTTSMDNFATSEIHYLYCRQGEDPIAIVSLTTVFSCYNISTPENFVDYPTKTGFLYQWNRRRSWAVVGPLNNYPLGHISDPTVNNGYEYKDYDTQKYICPSKYSYPDAEALDVMKATLNPANASYVWGYYADGFFDRRAVNENIVRSASGDIASAGGLFHSEITAIGIFLPTASWRDYKGEINSLTEHHKIGVIGHYWSQPQSGDGDWTVTRAVTTPLNAWALHLGTSSAVSYLEELNKASAANVRCMKLEGTTVYFDANEGLSTPRSITKKEGNITFPAGPAHKNNSFVFVNWASSRSGGEPTYNAGEVVDIATIGEKTVYAQYQMFYTTDEGKNLLVSKGNSGLNYADADAYCKNIAKDRSWRLPTKEELSSIWGQNKSLFSKVQYWTSSVGEPGNHYFVSGTDGGTWSSADSEAYNVRCVKEFSK